MIVHSPHIQTIVVYKTHERVICHFFLIACVELKSVCHIEGSYVNHHRRMTFLSHMRLIRSENKFRSIRLIISDDNKYIVVDEKYNVLYASLPLTNITG
jgi:hypothetical protein